MSTNDTTRRPPSVFLLDHGSVGYQCMPSAIDDRWIEIIIEDDEVEVTLVTTPAKDAGDRPDHRSDDGLTGRRMTTVDDYRRRVVSSTSCLHIVAEMLVAYWEPTGDYFQMEAASAMGDLCTILVSQGGGYWPDREEYHDKRDRIEAVTARMRANLDELNRPEDN